MEVPTPPSGTPSLPPRNLGRRMTDQVAGRELTFPIAMDRIVMWLIAGLVSWLCYSTMTMREQLVVMAERSQNYGKQMETFHMELERLTMADRVAAEQTKRLQIQAAEHGWKGGD